VETPWVNPWYSALRANKKSPQIQKRVIGKESASDRKDQGKEKR